MATERKIGPHVYRCEKLPAEPAIRLFLRVSKFFENAPEMMASVAFGGESSRAAFIAVALGGVDPDEAQGLLRELAETCTTGGDPCVVGVKPQGMTDLIDVAWFAMEAQFKDFLVASLPRPRPGETAGADAV
ncbi:hypothetical protein FF100_04930 [Methylobacterium terricola]|uniref:Uncharacterized protein n=1 Tax=Methylobacterium terricola TaxID=2583531 RepID=A0A5C4LQ01_9HYPH|nr:hypothetical protein [Methylobacterium terricola]TNC14922.1 hypothetical protein FF100_04930 [Methylobacterium terricola]